MWGRCGIMGFGFMIWTISYGPYHDMFCIAFNVLGLTFNVTWESLVWTS